MSVDQEVLRHRETWLSFISLMRWVVIGIVIILAGMAIFLT